jgi:predicted aldo/keto reductase-like oxidoreductase
MSNNNQNQINRRNLIKSLGAGALGSVLSAASVNAADVNKPQANEPNAPAPQLTPQKIPTRKLGKTGAKVPILSLGFGRPGDSVVLHQAIDWGVFHWDTSMAAANSEASIGAFLGKNPDERKDLFIVTKESKSKTPEDIENCLQSSLKRLNTNYIDLYFGVYMVNDQARFTDDIRKWAQDAKKRGVIKYFGFSTHENMAKCLSAAAKLGWIDAIQTKYDFRLTQDKEMQDAIDACHKAGVGLIAMKTQSMRSRGPASPADAEADKKLIAHFLQKGFTEGQAKIKAVLEDQRISSVCSAMNTTAMLLTNVAAVLDKTTLTAEDMEAFRQYANDTCDGYCAGCGYICGQASGVPVSDIMRALMYHDSYGDAAAAKELFTSIAGRTSQSLLSIDYNAAEAVCPNRMPIGKLVADAVNKLG